MIWWNMKFRLAEGNVTVHLRDHNQLNKVSGSETIGKRYLKEEVIDPDTTFLEEAADSLVMVSRSIFIVLTSESHWSRHKPCTIQLASLLCDLKQVIHLYESQYPHSIKIYANKSEICKLTVYPRHTPAHQE